MIASVPLSFPTFGFSAEESLVLQLAGLVLTERLVSLGGADSASPAGLTEREHDCLALVAEAKTDWEISVIMDLSEATARSTSTAASSGR